MGVAVADDNGLHEGLRELEAILDAAPDSIVLLHIDGSIARASEATRSLFLIGPEALKGETISSSMVHAEDISRVLETLAMVVDGEEEALVRYRAAPRDGRFPRVLESHFRLLRDLDERPHRVVMVTRDVTEQARLSDETDRLRREAEEANRQKSAFLSRVSHELRTPLNSVLGFAQLLQGETLTDSQRDSVDHIYRAGRHLVLVIDDLLDMSRVESGHAPITLEAVELAPLVDEGVGLIRSIALGRTVSVESSVPAGVTVVADRHRLRQVLLNLLSNAVKFNRIGGTVSIDASGRKAGKVRLTVSDTGIGIDPGRAAEVFQPFSRLDAERRGIEGSGIGLTLSRQLVLGMDGDIGF
ncbi:MAG TPA: ATP-binding protein, partial [Acidimicrobiales bacterium]|nr:ATP-binding protein [Acidimicrobiales bacterium]